MLLMHCTAPHIAHHCRMLFNNALCPTPNRARNPNVSLQPAMRPNTEYTARSSSIERASPPHFQTPMLWCFVCVDPAESCALCVAAGAERCTAGSFAPATSSAYTMSDSTGARLVPALCTCGAWTAIASCRCCTSCPALAKYSCSKGACGLLKLGSRCCIGATSSGLVVAGLYGAEAANSSWWRKA